MVKAELERLLVERNAEIEQLRLQLVKLQGDNDVLRRKLGATVLAPQPTTPYREVLAKARETAMRTGKTVRVGGAA